MDEATFKATFIATFLATWCVANYDDACMRGEQERLNKPPVEDAKYLAARAWEHMQEVCP